MATGKDDPTKDKGRSDSEPTEAKPQPEPKGGWIIHPESGERIPRNDYHDEIRGKQ